MPAALAALAVIGYFLLPVSPPLTGETGLSDYVFRITSLLPGFFIAALAAVATFQRAELDETMPSPSPTLKVRTGDDTSLVSLSHRVFLCHLFSYLTVTSLLLILLSVSGEIIAPNVNYIIRAIDRPASGFLITLSLKSLYTFVLSFLFFRLILVTLFGLYFLVERIHRVNS
ncbi:hypothetical protein [Tabrizicola soli]|uniref:Uncharacterized protein n=1 Tax=Tabrizicola soli TaxID=2185115 RepID=A0ABV7DPM9_9RHOB|nr:hypothetical protein [Tabrizicola soli]